MKKKIIYSCLLSLSVFACSIPNQEIKNDKLNIKSNLKDKKFKTKSLSIFHHPNRNAEFNANAYQYAFPPPDIAPNTAFNHYQYARDHEYQGRIRNPEYFKALQCVDEGFDEVAYYQAYPEIKFYVDQRANYIANQQTPEAWWPESGYFHYKNWARFYEPWRMLDTSYKNALKSTKAFREEAYFNAHPNIHSTIKYALDEKFTTANFVNGYEHYILNKTPTFNPLDNSTYQTAIDDHIDGYWNDSYLLAFNDILASGNYTNPYPHYNYYGRNEGIGGRLANGLYTSANSGVDIHPGQTKTIEFSGTKKTFTFIGLPNWKYRFILNEMSEGDSYLKIIDPDTNEIIIESDDTYGLDSFVEFKVPLKKKYIAEVSTSNDGISSNTPQGRFLLTMFHSFYDSNMIAKDDFRMSNLIDSWAYGGYDINTNQFYKYTTTWIPDSNTEYLTSPTWLSGGGGVVGHNIKNEEIISNPITLEPRQIILHPGGNGEKAVLRWTAQMNGNYSINALFKGVSGNLNSQLIEHTTTDVHIYRGSTEIFNGNIDINNKQSIYNNSIILNAGETIDFVVGNGANNNSSYDSTGLDVNITKT